MVSNTCVIAVEFIFTFTYHFVLSSIYILGTCSQDYKFNFTSQFYLFIWEVFNKGIKLRGTFEIITYYLSFKNWSLKEMVRRNLFFNLVVNFKKFHIFYLHKPPPHPSVSSSPTNTKFHCFSNLESYLKFSGIESYPLIFTTQSQEYFFKFYLEKKKNSIQIKSKSLAW